MDCVGSDYGCLSFELAKGVLEMSGTCAIVEDCGECCVPFSTPNSLSTYGHLLRSKLTLMRLLALLARHPCIVSIVVLLLFGLSGWGWMRLCGLSITWVTPVPPVYLSVFTVKQGLTLVWVGPVIA